LFGRSEEVVAGAEEEAEQEKIFGGDCLGAMIKAK